MVVDASVWISYFMPDDAHHEASQRWLERSLRAEDPMIAPTLLLAEVSGAIARLTGNSTTSEGVAQQLESILTLRWVALDLPLARIARHVAASLRLRGADAVYVATAHQAGVTLATWDAQQRERGGLLIRALSPDQLL